VARLPWTARGLTGSGWKPPAALRAVATSRGRSMAPGSARGPICRGEQRRQAAVVPLHGNGLWPEALPSQRPDLPGGIAGAAYSVRGA
jgi:hypothetical protein